MKGKKSIEKLIFCVHFLLIELMLEFHGILMQKIMKKKLFMMIEKQVWIILGER
jgi:hypothetical protein